MLTSIVIPAHNEADILADSTREIVEGLRPSGLPFEVVLVENGSTDRTGSLAAQLAEEYPEVRALQRAEADYGRALREGFLAAEGDVVVNFDVDFYDLDFLRRAVPLMEDPDGPVIVVGSKRGPEANDQRTLLRRVVTRVFSELLRLLFGLGVSDTHGVKAMRREPLLPLVARCQLGADLFDTELVLRAERAGMSTAELPVTVVETRPARTSILKRIPRAFVGLVRLRVLLWREGRREGRVAQ